MSDESSMTPAASMTLGPEVLKALGIECKYVLDFKVSFKGGDLVTVSVRYAVPAQTKMVEVLRKYRLTARPEAAATEAPAA